MFVFDFKNPAKSLKWVNMDDRGMGEALKSELVYSGRKGAT